MVHLPSYRNIIVQSKIDQFLSLPPADELSARLGEVAALVEFDILIPRFAQSAPKEPV